MSWIPVFLGVVCCFIKGCIAGEVCFNVLELEGRYCEYGCCKEISDGCCILPLPETTLIIIIVASVIGFITLISICICVCCCACANNGRQSGQVMPNPTTQVIYTPGMQPGYAHQPYPPPYGSYPQPGGPDQPATSTQLGPDPPSTSTLPDKGTNAPLPGYIPPTETSKY